MHRFPSLARTSIAAIAALACLAAAPASSGGVAPAPEAKRGGGSGAAAGLAGTPIPLATNSTIHGFDIAMAADGTAYVAWIASAGLSSRSIGSCVLPPGATGCLNGGQAISSLTPTEGESVHVLPPAGANPATIVYFRDTAESISGPMNAKISTVTVQPTGVLANGAEAAAYSFGSLLTAERGPDGAIWVVMAESIGAGNEIRVLPGLAGTAKTFNPPFPVYKGKLAFTGAGKAVLVFDKYAAIDEKLRVVRQTDTGWSGISAVNGTWNVGGAFDVVKQGAVRLVAAINKASYYPRIAAWTGSEFGPLSLTGHKSSCPKFSHDLFADTSGRVADAYADCDRVVIANHPKAKKGAFVGFPIGGTSVGEPQIATNPRGLGWVAWARLDTAEHRLLVAPIRLPALKTSKTVKKTFGSVTVTGPVSCLPAVQTKIGVTAKGLNGWSVVSKTLKLDGAVHGTGLNGTQFPPNSSHTVSGTGKFKKGGQTRSLTVSLGFKSCPDVAIT